MEIWKQTTIREDYEVSNLGRVRRKKRSPRHKRVYPEDYHILKPKVQKNGYLFVRLGYKEMRIHRLVAIAFLDNPNNKAEVNHLDGDKFNNCLSNLEWATKKENMEHAYKIGLIKQYDRRGSKNPNYKKDKKII